MVAYSDAFRRITGLTCHLAESRMVVSCVAIISGREQAAGGPQSLISTCWVGCSGGEANDSPERYTQSLDKRAGF